MKLEKSDGEFVWNSCVKSLLDDQEVKWHVSMVIANGSKSQKLSAFRGVKVVLVPDDQRREVLKLKKASGEFVWNSWVKSLLGNMEVKRHVLVVVANGGTSRELSPSNTHVVYICCWQNNSDFLF